MKNKQLAIPDTKIVDQEPTAILLDYLNGIFRFFQDGIINDDAFVGGLPMSYLNADGSLDALTLEESKQIRHALMEAATQPNRKTGFHLMSLIDWMPFFKGKNSEKKIGQDQKSSPAIIGSDGRLLPLSKEMNLISLIESRLKEQGLHHLCAYWYAINEKVDKKRHEEMGGDLKIIDHNRRKLIAKRLNATPFEHAAQEFSAHISSRFCDENGDIISPVLLEYFVNKVIENLLERTKAYWPVAPLLSLFDAIVVPVLRPMLYPHRTWTSEHEYFSEDGAYDVGQLANKRTSFETTPIWNDSARQQVLDSVERALKNHLSSRLWRLQLFDTFAPYNREIHSSKHIDPTRFKGKIRSFGPPVHTQDVMQLIQPIPKKPEEKVLEKVMTYRSVEKGVWY